MAINITNLSKSRDQTGNGENSLLGLNGLTLPPLPANDLTVIIGRNGSGKSTLLHCIGGLLEFEHGEITVDIPNTLIRYSLEAGGRSRIPTEARLQIGYIFQQKALWNHLSVADNIKHPLITVHKFSDGDAHERALNYMELFEITYSTSKKYPNELSGGEQRKVAIARTFAIQPQMLLIDELEANLDPSSFQVTMNILENEYLNPCKTVVAVSHSVEFLERFAPNVIVLHEGNAVASANSIKELLTTGKEDQATERLLRSSVDPSSRRWFLATQSLEAAIRISASSAAERDENILFARIGKEISDLIKNFSPEGEHLLLVATTAPGLTQSSPEVRIRCAEKSSNFVLDGDRANKLGPLVCQQRVDEKRGVMIYDLVVDYVKLFESGGFNLIKDPVLQSYGGGSSLMDAMLQNKEGGKLVYRYTARHPVIEGAYNIQIPIPDSHTIEKASYYEFSKATKNVYLIACIVDNEVKGIISIDTNVEEKWQTFMIQQLILIGNMIAITIKDHEE